MDTQDFGRIQYLTPALHLSETPPDGTCRLLPPRVAVQRLDAGNAHWLCHGTDRMRDRRRILTAQCHEIAYSPVPFQIQFAIATASAPAILFTLPAHLAPSRTAAWRPIFVHRRAVRWRSSPPSCKKLAAS